MAVSRDISTPCRKLFANRDDKVSRGELSVEEVEPGLCVPLGISANELRRTVECLTVSDGMVFVATYPKCGTTWMQQIVKLIWNHGQEDGRDIDEILPFLDPMTSEEVQSLSSPKGFKTHMPYRLLPGGVPTANVHAKYINVYRNPKDVVVSLFHHAQALKYKDAVRWDDYFEQFMSGKVIYGSYFKHVLEWWKHRDVENVLILCYEEMKKDPVTAIKSVSLFLGYQLSLDILTNIATQTEFSKMKLNPAANNSWMDDYRKKNSCPFMRKGVVGDWRNYFSQEQSMRIDQEIEKYFNETELVFDFGDVNSETLPHQ